jgi:hypothetical protein
LSSLLVSTVCEVAQFIELESFRSLEEARLSKNTQEKMAEYVQKVQELVAFDENTFRGENTPIKTSSERKGNISSEQFAQTFGFRGVEFGNWVNNTERQQRVNMAYDALMDLATVIGIPPQAISLNGELGFAFGARGKRGASAHYEPGKVVINLTKENGAGTIAHEWFHAFDNYLSRKMGSSLSYVSESQKYEREAIVVALNNIRSAFRQTQIIQRSDKADKRKGALYFGQAREYYARGFEVFIKEELKKQGFSNSFLVDFKVGVPKEASHAEVYPYAIGEEVELIYNAFKNLFNNVEVAENDTMALYQRAPQSLNAEKTSLTTKLLKKLEGRTTVSKQFISDLTNSPDLKQTEKDIIRDVLEAEGNTVNVTDFAEKVKAELLPLTVKNQKISLTKSQAKTKLQNMGIIFERDMDGGLYPKRGDEFVEYDDEPKEITDLIDSVLGNAETYNDVNVAKFEQISLPSDIRGNVKNYRENVWESPVKTSAGSIHFGGATENYFGHTRIEDMADNKTRRVIEVQSDLYQKGNLEREQNQLGAKALYRGKEYKIDGGNYQTFYLKDSDGKITQARTEEVEVLKSKDFLKLSQYSNPTAHFRMVREELKKASDDGIKKVQFPTGETAMKIEGLGENHSFMQPDGRGFISPQQLEVGLEVRDRNGGNDWIITDVLGEGKFKAVPKDQYDANPDDLIGLDETFDISGKVDTNNPIYRFYEKDLGKYLFSKYGARLVVDPQGVKWYEVEITPEMAGDVEAFQRGRDELMRQETLASTVEKRGDILLIDSGRMYNGMPVKEIDTDALIGADRSGYSYLDTERVKFYEQKIENKEKIEPIIVDPVEGNIYTEDGKHRLQAYRNKGISTVEVIEYNDYVKKHQSPREREVIGTDAMGAPYTIKDMVDTITTNLSQYEAQAIMDKYFDRKEVPTIFVQNIRTPDGFDAFGRYFKGMVTMIQNPQESTPHHEAIHAFMDLFTAPEHKTMYLESVMNRTDWKNIKEYYLSEGAQLTDLQIAEEFIADNFTAYVKRRNSRPLFKRWFDAIIDFLKKIFDRGNVDNLYNDVMNRKRSHVSSKVPGQTNQAPLFQTKKPRTAQEKIIDFVLANDSIPQNRKEDVIRKALEYLKVPDTKIEQSITTTPAMRSEQYNVPIAFATGEENQSRVYERLKDEYGQTDDLSYTQMSLKQDTANAINFVEKYPIRAKAIALGQELAPEGITATAINIAYADMLEGKNDIKGAIDVVKTRSLRLTRLGQEISAENGRVSQDTPDAFIKEVLRRRRNTVRDYVFKNPESAIMKAMQDKKDKKGALKEKVKKDKKEVSREVVRATKVESFVSFIKSLEC